MRDCEALRATLIIESAFAGKKYASTVTAAEAVTLVSQGYELVFGGAT